MSWFVEDSGFQGLVLTALGNPQTSKYVNSETKLSREVSENNPPHDQMTAPLKALYNI
jgi:hypothetical protein